MIEKLVAGMTERFGELKLQEGKYHHIGHEYEQTWDDQGCTTITDGQEFCTKTIEPVAIPPGVKHRLLTEKEKSELRHLNGEMGYGADTRPDAMVELHLQNPD